MWLSWLFILAGAALFFAAGWQARLLHRHRRLFRTLQRAAERIEDPLAWPRQAWPTLQSAGLRALTWRGHWFGQRIEGHLGQEDASTTHQEDLSQGDDLQLEVSGALSARGGEAKWLAEAMWNQFLLYWRASVHERKRAIDAALLQQAEQALIIRHELRNFAQWFDFALSGFSPDATDSDLLAAARGLAAQAEAARARIRHLAQPRRETESHLPPAYLPRFVREVAAFHGVEAIIEAGDDLRTGTPAMVWLTILDNLFSNLGREARQQGLVPTCPIRLTAQADSGVELRLSLPEGLVFALPPKRLFEPFSSGRPGGLGLGLYLARRLGREAGGDLTAVIADSGQTVEGFVLKVP